MFVCCCCCFNFVVVSILHQLAKEVINVDNQMSPKAEIFYKEAIEHCPNTALVSLLFVVVVVYSCCLLLFIVVCCCCLQYRESLAEWYLSVGQIEECEQECVTLLQMDPNNDTATVVCIIIIIIYACNFNY